MKHYLHNSLRALFLSLAVFLSLPMLAEKVEISGINYDLDAETKQATVIKKSSGEYSGEVVIPESVELEGIVYSVTSIGEKAFSYCRGLTSVTIPNSVTSIGGYAFAECWGLTSVTIGNSVTSIGRGAFEYCPGLTEMKVDANNSKYDSREGCNAIIETSSNTLIFGCQTTVIPNSVTSIGGCAFFGSEGLTSVTIPNSVTRIGYDAFGFCGLTSVTIPNSVTSIEGEAFFFCSRLTSVTIPNSVTSIEHATFYGCDGLTSVTIPNSVTSIGGYAFCDCSGLTSVTIPNSVTSIGQEAFSGCKGLTSIVVEDGNPVYDSRNNCNAIIETSTNTLHSGCKTTIIPNSVTSIGDRAFYYCKGLTSVTIPNSVTSIGDRAFDGCTGLTSVTIGNSVTGIGESAFSGCSGLTSVTIGNSVTSIGDWAFSSCSGLTSVTIPNSVESIGSSAFSSCKGLTSVTIGNSVTSIGDRAFDGCTGLTSVHISDIAAWCNIDFKGSTSNPLGYARHLYLNGEEVKDLVIPNSVTSIRHYAFSSCKGLTSVTIGNSVTNIGEYAFWGCSGLTAVHISDIAAWCNIDFARSDSNPLYYAHHLYLNGEEVKDLVIPNSATSIGDWAFYDCSGLTSVTIPNSVTSIGEYAFSSCDGLTSVTIGNSVTSIGDDALRGCSNLSCITCLNPFPPACEEFTFYNVLTSKCKLLVPIGSESAYSAANGWKEFSEIIGIETEIDSEPETYSAFVINDTTVMAGSTFTMPVELKNSCEVTAFQCDIYLPEGITLQKNNMDKYEISLDENRKDDHTITIAEQPDGSIRIVVASLSSSTFSGTEGTLLNMALLAAEDTSGEKNIAIKNVYISEANGKRHDLADAEATVTIQTYTPADVNNDGMIAVDDVVLTINAVLGNVPENFVFDAADMNGDGRILIDDVVRIINVVLGIYAPPVSNVRRNDVDERFILNQKETGVGISVSNAAGYTAMQYDMHMPEGAEVSDVRFTGKSNHKVSFRKINKNVVRVVVVSLTNEVFSGNELLDVVIESALDTEISIKGANVATRGGIKGNVQDASINIGGNATAIDQLLDGMARADVHDLNGRLVKKNAATITDLQKGIYIINGKRIIR